MNEPSLELTRKAKVHWADEWRIPFTKLTIWINVVSNVETIAPEPPPVDPLASHPELPLS